MRRKTTLIAVCLILLAVVLSGAQGSEKRTALVIGNSAYKTAPLKNPESDARDMAAALEEMNFSVTMLINANLEQMKTAARTFGKKHSSGGVGLFYYAGHGMQVEGVNYLIPVNVDIKDEKEVRYNALAAGQVLANMESAGNATNIVILDACRDNPFARSFRSSSRGLSVLEAPSGTIVVYSTAPGSVAADGKGRNGIFTAALLKYIGTPDMDIETMLRDVRSDVIRETSGSQVPWSSSSLTESFYFTSAALALARIESDKRQIEEEVRQLEAEITRRQKAITDAKSNAERQRLEIEQQRQQALQEAKLIEQKNLAREAERQRAEAERQRREAAARTARRDEEEVRRREMEVLAAEKREKAERLKLAGDDPDLLIENVDILEKSIAEIETTFEEAWRKTKAEIERTYGVKQAEVNAMKADPWESDNEFKERRDKARSELTSAKARELRQGESEHERSKQAQLAELKRKLTTAIQTLESKSWTLTGSDVTVTPGEFDRERKMWPFVIKSNAPEVPFTTLLVKNLSSASDLREAYSETDNAVKAGALAGTIIWSIKRKEATTYGSLYTKAAYQVVVRTVRVADLSRNNKQLAYAYENSTAASFNPGRRNRPSSTGATLRFTSKKYGAEVVYRGVVIGKTPFTTDIFRVGKAEIELYYSRYKEKLKKTITVTAGTNNIDVSLSLSIGDTYAGGIVFYLDGRGGGLVAAPSDQGEKKWSDARKICQDLVLNGYDDWFLPSKDELYLMYRNLKKRGLGGFASANYWGSSEDDSYGAWMQAFATGHQYSNYGGNNSFRVRAVRAF